MRRSYSIPGIDADQSGVLSYWEFMKGLERLGVKLSDNRMELVMRSLDDDGNGEIELSEFENALEITKKYSYSLGFMNL